MTSNRVNLEQLIEMSARDASALPSDQLAMLLEDIAILKDRATKASAVLGAALDLRYGEKAAQLRRAQGKDTGIVHLDDGDCEVTADLPKTVSWDQSHLRAMCSKIKNEWRGDVLDYISIEMKVPESKFAAWPKDLQAEFLPGRTVKTGKPSYRLEMVSKREAA